MPGFLRLSSMRIFIMSTYSSNPNEDRRDDEDYGEEYTWWDEYEDALDEEIQDGRNSC
jgi:hypothetical protein